MSKSRQVRNESQYEQRYEEWQEVLDGAFIEVEDGPRRRAATGSRIVAALLIAVFLAPLALPVLHFLQAQGAESETSPGSELESPLPFTARVARGRH